VSSSSAADIVISTTCLQSDVRNLSQYNRPCNFDVPIELRCALSTCDDGDVLASDDVMESAFTRAADPNESVGFYHDVVGFTMNLTVHTKDGRVVPMLSGEKFELKVVLGKQILGHFPGRRWGGSKRAEQQSIDFVSELSGKVHEAKGRIGIGGSHIGVDCGSRRRDNRVGVE